MRAIRPLAMLCMATPWSLLSSACSVLLPTDTQQCVSDADCSQAATGVRDLVCDEGLCVAQLPWGCVENPPTQEDMSLEMDLTLRSITTDMLVVGATVRVCATTDVECSSPNMTATSDAQGLVRLVIESGDYLEFEAEGYPNLVIMNTAGMTLLKSDPLKTEFTVGSIEFFTNLTSLAGVTPLASHGHLQARSVNCLFEDVAGVQFTLDKLDSNTKLIYLINDLPSATAKETDVETGEAWFFNVPTDTSVSLSAQLGSAGMNIGEPVAVITRPGWITQATNFPKGVRIDSPAKR